MCKSILLHLRIVKITVSKNIVGKLEDLWKTVEVQEDRWLNFIKKRKFRAGNSAY